MKLRTCRKCKKDFFLKNKLHSHLKICKNKIKNINRITDFQEAFVIIIIDFTITLVKENEHNINEQKKIEETTYLSEKLSKRKSRVVIDIRGLNRITTTNFYPLPLQGDVINLLQGMECISILNDLFFFFQFNV